MGWYPGWDSLDSVRNWHTVFEISGIAFLALLVGAEILAFQYGHRKDELTAIAERSVESQRKADASAAEAKRKTEVAELQKELQEAGEKVAHLEQLTARRTLTPEQRAKILMAVKPFKGSQVGVSVLMGDSEAAALAAQFVAIFREAGWDAGPNEGFSQVLRMGAPEYGIQVTVNQQEAEAGALPARAAPLMTVLHDIGLSERIIFINPAVEAGKIDLRVNPKPPK